MKSRNRVTKQVVCALIIAGGTLRAADAAATEPDANWGLTYLPGGGLGPMKGIYFYPGNPLPGFDQRHFTRWPRYSGNDPLSAPDLHWDDSASARAATVAEMRDTHANVILMSFWGSNTPGSPDPPNFSGPMKPIFPNSYQFLFQEVAGLPGQPLRVMPVIEGIDDNNGDQQTCLRHPWRDLPIEGPIAQNWLYQRVQVVVSQFLSVASYRNVWAQMVDRYGQARYALNLMHVVSHGTAPVNAVTAATQIRESLDAIAAEIDRLYGFKIGFTFDPWILGCSPYLQESYTPKWTEAAFLTGLNDPPPAGASVLGLKPGAPEVTWGECLQNPDIPEWAFNACLDPNTGEPRCRDCTEHVKGFKREWIANWVNVNMPVLLDLSAGYDAQNKWPYWNPEPGPYYHTPLGPIGVYGDTAETLYGFGTGDMWRNHQSQMKYTYPGGRKLKGMVWDTWNGYVEGNTAVPASYRPWLDYTPAVPEEVNYTQINWLTEQFTTDPQTCDHHHWFLNYSQAHVYGAICEHWQELGGGVAPEDVYGHPISDEEDTAQGALDRAWGLTDPLRSADPIALCS